MVFFDPADGETGVCVIGERTEGVPFRDAGATTNPGETAELFADPSEGATDCNLGRRMRFGGLVAQSCEA